MLSQQDCDKYLSGCFIYDCAVRSSNVFSFIVIEHAEDAASADKKLINYFIDRPPGQCIGRSTYSGFSGARIAASLSPKEQVIMVARNGDVAVLGGGEGGMENPVPKGKAELPLYTSMHALATIDGAVYAVGPWRAVCRRDGKNQWTSIADRTTLPVPARNSFGSNDEGFDAIDGFNRNDLYCGGGNADLWRFDGNQWHEVEFPTNMILENICCAGDGYVYIGLQSGSVMRGRRNRWEMIYAGSFSLPFKDMVWFTDRVWCTSDYGLWQIKDGEFSMPDIDPEIRACSGNLSVGDGVMLLAGMCGAAVYNGISWSPLISP